jgi:CBS domain-containing protein
MPTMQAKDLMTRDVITVTPDTPILGIARLLADRHISAVPVTDAERRVLGIVSEGDLLRQVGGFEDDKPGFFEALFSDPAKLAAQYAKSHGRVARDVMTSEVISVTEEAPAAEIAAKLDQNHIRRVLVLKDKRLAGVVTRADLLRAIVTQQLAQTPGETSDEGIYRAVLKAMKQQPWASTFYTTVTVKDGVVGFYGYCGSDEYRRALRVLAENVAGVKAVEDHLVIGPLYEYV